MKKYILIITITLGFVSCKDYLDKRPDLGFTEEIVFNNFQSALGYFNKVYDITDDYLVWQSQGQPSGRSYLTGEMSDEGGNVWKDRSILGTVLNRGTWLSNDNIGEVSWKDENVGNNQGKVIPKSFYGIRICNRILEKIPNMGQLKQDQKDQLIGQAYFFRGWFYFEIIRRIGGFIILDELNNSDDSGNVPRQTYAECNEFIINDMDKSIEILPHRWPDLQTGRPTKSSAYALKSMAQLYAASPLMTNGIDRTDPKTEYDADRVQLAAQYAKECLDYLESNKSVYDQTMMPKEEYANIFYFPRQQFTSREQLWYVNYTGRNRETDLTILWQTRWMSNRPGNYGPPVFCPSQQMIDKFETINGYTVELRTDGWKCDDPAFNPEEPFRNRDPRLYNNIILPGERFGNYNTAVGTEEDRLAHYLAVWPGGRDFTIYGNQEGGRGDILTRYLCKKYQWPTSINGSNGTNDVGGNPGYLLNSFNAVFIRTTQVWLDYAEAMNEAYGPDDKPAGYQWSAVEALNIVRERVGQCPVRSEHTTDKLKFRNKIRDERAVELFAENHRWFDIRRWMIAEQLFAQPNPIYGVEVDIKTNYTSNFITQHPPGETVAEREAAMYGKCFTYKLNDRITEEIRVFERKHYWYPIRRDEINRFSAVKQNPGWQQ